jgi:hypothetical protein
MTNILDRIARRSASAEYGRFQPSDQGEYFALRLAQKLDEAAAARHYAELLEQYSEAQLLLAYRRAKASGSHQSAARSFHMELGRVKGRSGNDAPIRRLAAIRIERRAVAIVILEGDHLAAPPQVRQLSSSSNKALGSAAVFISHMLEKYRLGRYPLTTAALETISCKSEVLRGELTKIISGVLVEQNIGIWEVAKQDVLASFGNPCPRFRAQARKAISNIWPGINGNFGSPLIKDAMAIGLYCQVEHLFNL